jgi:hypothetical protein
MNRTALELNLSKNCRASREHLRVFHRDASAKRQQDQTMRLPRICPQDALSIEVNRSTCSQNGVIAAATPVIYAVVLF